MTQITFSIKFIKEVPEETYVVTKDIKPLFKNIPTSEGITVTKRALDKQTNKTVANKKSSKHS